jgi:hypothetical protein
MIVELRYQSTSRRPPRTEPGEHASIDGRRPNAAAYRTWITQCGRDATSHGLHHSNLDRPAGFPSQNLSTTPSRHNLGASLNVIQNWRFDPAPGRPRVLKQSAHVRAASGFLAHVWCRHTDSKCCTISKFSGVSDPSVLRLARFLGKWSSRGRDADAGRAKETRRCNLFFVHFLTIWVRRRRQNSRRVFASTRPVRPTRVRFALQLDPVYHVSMEETSLSLLARLRRSPESETWNRLVDLYAPLIRVWLRKYDLQDSDADDEVTFHHRERRCFDQDGPAARRLRPSPNATGRWNVASRFRVPRLNQQRR